MFLEGFAGLDKLQAKEADFVSRLGRSRFWDSQVLTTAFYKQETFSSNGSFFVLVFGPFFVNDTGDCGFCRFALSDGMVSGYEHKVTQV